MVKFNTIWNYDYSDKMNYPEFSDVSETVPDMSLSIRDILERFSRGQSLPVGRDGVYDDDPDFDDNVMDPIDMVEADDEFNMLLSEIENSKLKKDEVYEEPKSEVPPVESV